MVLNFVRMELVKVPRKCVRCCVAVNGGLVTFESVVCGESTLPVIARGDVDLAAVQALAGVHGAALGVRAALLPGLASPAVRENTTCQI